MEREAIWSVRRSVAVLYFMLFGAQVAVTILWLWHDSDSILELWVKASAPIITSAAVALIATEVMRSGWRLLVVFADIIREKWERRQRRVRHEQLDDLMNLVLPVLEQRAARGDPPPTVEELGELVDQLLAARDQE